ncbi:CHAD domain-containing protein [Inquilinus sp. CAU 1745]|uniref:CYTH and CHAD domain-containing protein n=1 Tax=Inquilinus sp. CAU 1745 TaxID=3140369 RepID=UPI00325BCE44
MLPPAADDREIELKLLVDPAAMEALRRAPEILERASGRPEVRRLENVYYDTADRRLRKKGLALRVRRRGRRFVQTLKAAGPAGDALERAEWEVPVPSGAPDIAAFGPSAREALGLLTPSELQPVFTTRVRREQFLLDLGDGTAIEAAFDQGRILATGSSEPISEIELELKEGQPAALYRLALKLHRVAPVRPSVRAKSDRGHDRAAGIAPAWRKAGKLALDPAGSAEDALEKVLRHCLAHWLSNESAAEDGSDPEGVHQMRVALRRLRSAAALFRPLLPARDSDWLTAETRWIAAALGPARDWDVFLAETVEPLERAAGRGDAGLRDLRERAETARGEGYEGVRRLLAAPRYAAFLLTFGAWLEERGWRSPGMEAALSRPVTRLAAAALDRRHRKLLKAGRHFGRLTPEERHEVRIALKKLRYAVDFFRSVPPAGQPAGKMKAYRKALGGLQDALGHMNDGVTACKLLDALGADGRAAGLVLGWHARGAEALEPKLLAAWNGFAQARPFWKAGNH